MLSGTSYHILSPIQAASYNFYKSRGFFIFRYFDDKKEA